MYTYSLEFHGQFFGLNYLKNFLFSLKIFIFSITLQATIRHTKFFSQNLRLQTTKTLDIKILHIISDKLLVFVLLFISQFISKIKSEAIKFV